MSLTEVLGIKYPIIQGAMAQIATADLAAAVSNAGGLGIIASGGFSPDRIREEIRRCKELTDKPFGVNVMLMHPNKEEIARIVVEEKVKVVTTGAGSPAPYMNMWKEAGIIVIPVIPNVKIAKKMEAIGADALVAEGTEAGGHVGESTTLALVPQIVDAVNIPVVAAGGRGIAAAFALGAQGVQIGTRFIATNECPVHDNFKNAVLNCGDADTVVTGRTLGAPVRGIKNPMTIKFLELEKRGASRDEFEELGTGALRKAAIDGDIENGSVMTGQISGIINKITSVEEAIEAMISEAEEVFEALGKIKFI
ncbi:nitronate monooxygenase [uncultured Clostridium sp.]|uniref:nitronate monooxygenase n=1 Tax=uncultured Clostridium sp. TaxID=59620 RepID=UPI00280B7515|nr:nitronate monooxygenase [uncultured Clostridium sp.]